MRVRPAGGQVFQPSVEKIAMCIRDPERRQRFLESAEPHLRPRTNPRRFGRAWASRIGFVTIAAVAGLATILMVTNSTGAVGLPAAQLPVRVADVPSANVWLVARSGDEETYSNGLHIDGHYTVKHDPRSYLAYPADRRARPVKRRDPAGIVFHTTESRLPSFEAGNNDELQRQDKSLLTYVQRQFSYHFLIDRFGRVYRIVAESDIADHAWPSVWADGEWLYANLNASFFGVSLEARTQPGQTESTVTPAQVRSAAMLTEMLRSKYHIRAANCVTHAQVSVNPANSQIGLHTDWASGFPFEQVGLPNNYALPLPAVWAFGFHATAEYRRMTGARLEEGVDRGESALLQSARAIGLPAASYRQRLQGWYLERAGVVSPGEASQMR
jgi:hypothetical protein